jgi:hypothetical protein
MKKLLAHSTILTPTATTATIANNTPTTVRAGGSQQVVGFWA